MFMFKSRLQPLLRRNVRITAGNQSALYRLYATGSNQNNNDKKPTGPNQDILPHVSEEAARINEIMGEEGPDFTGAQPVQEILKRDGEALEKAPQVIQEEIQTPNSGSASADASKEMSAIDQIIAEGRVSTRFSSPTLTDTHNYPPTFYPPPTTHKLDPTNPISKYPLPTLPLPSTSHMDHRYAPLISQVVNLFMKDGKKATAQTHLQRVLDILRTKPAPKENTRYNLIGTAPPLNTLPKNPLSYLETAIDSVAPLMRLKAIKGSGGFSNTVPEPLTAKQRRRAAITWMLKAADGKREKMGFAERFAEEVVAVVEGRSSAWERRLQVHKTSVGARANVKVQI